MLNQFRRLPWFVALAAFVLYACTMGSEMTANNLPLVSKLAGWNNTLIVGQPLVWLITLPILILSAAWVPLAVKLVSALLAAAILGLLVRTVQLLPWDKSWDNASKLVCALPIIAACVLCGLELSYWQEATSTCGELTDLLLLAASIWLLFEYNARQQPKWLYAATIVWGVGMAENWLMMVALPLYIAGIIWLERLRFFRWKLILRLALLGLAGFSVYVLAPTANGLLPNSPWDLHQSWLASLHETKNIFLVLFYEFWRGHRLLLVAIIIYFLVPTLPLVVRMRDEGTRNKLGVDKFQIWLYRGLRLGLLLACFWLAFDPSSGPRQMTQRQAGIHTPMLTFDYLNALGAAFLLGNLLLAAQPVAGEERRRSRKKIQWGKFAVPVASTCLALVAIGLVIRNSTPILCVNFHPLQQFGDAAVESLPPGGGVILSDYPDRLIVVQAALARHHRAHEWLAVDTRVLPTVNYRAWLEKCQPDGWLTDQNRRPLSEVDVIRLLMQVARTNRLYYLNPSYGDPFEAFYLAPTGMISEMKLRGKNPLEVPTTSPAVAAANEQFWSDLWNHQLSRLVEPSPSKEPSTLAKKIARFGFKPIPHEQDRMVADWYSVCLEGWAVELQKLGRLKEAQTRFEEALQLNTNNLSARISLACNADLQSGKKMGLADVTKVTGQLGNPDRIKLIWNNGGPFDEPTVDFVLGCVFLDHGLLVQAAEELERARTLSASGMAAELALAEIYNRLRMPDRSRPLINHILEEKQSTPDNLSLDLNLAVLDCRCWLLQTNVVEARSVLQSVLKNHPDNQEVADRVVMAYLAFGDYTNALSLVDNRLSTNPDNVSDLDAKALILMQCGRSAEAVPIFDHVLTLTNQPSAQINRAFAQIASKNFAAAQTDLDSLQKAGNASGIVNYGLAVVAEHNEDTNSAKRYLEFCITNTPAGAPLWRQAVARLRSLTPTVVPK